MAEKRNVNKAEYAKFRIFAKHLFINEGYTKLGIEKYLTISAPTIIKWSKEDNWDVERTQVMASPHKIKGILLAELERVSSGEKPTIDADALAKISKVIEALDDKVSIPVMFSVFKEFDNWMAEENEETGTEIRAYQKKFLLHKINADG
jgi:hypothetical protein